MKLSIKQTSLGPLETNAVLIIDEDNKKAIVVDPSFNPEVLAQWAENEGIKIVQI